MSPIDAVAITRPCSALWTAMAGDDRARFCGLCGKTVYDTAGLDSCELEAMLAAPKPPCLRVHRDGAGRVLTRDRIAAVASLALAACNPHPADTGDTAGATTPPSAIPEMTVSPAIEVPAILGEPAPVLMGRVAPPKMGKPIAR
jgi:hypothetical protein